MKRPPRSKFLTPGRLYSPGGPLDNVDNFTAPDIRCPSGGFVKPCEYIFHSRGVGETEFRCHVCEEIYDVKGRAKNPMLRMVQLSKGLSAYCQMKQHNVPGAVICPDSGMRVKAFGSNLGFKKRVTGCSLRYVSEELEPLELAALMSRANGIGYFYKCIGCGVIYDSEGNVPKKKDRGRVKKRNPFQDFGYE